MPSNFNATPGQYVEIVILFLAWHVWAGVVMSFKALV